jgi:hypothetical protein
MDKIWVYLSSSEISAVVYAEIIKKGNDFIANWKAHNVPLSATIEIYKNRIIIINVDETGYNASGCSIDKLHKFIKELELSYNIQLLNRLLIGFQNGDKVNVLPSSKVTSELEKGTINENTMVYDLTVSNSNEYKNWVKPLKETWLKKYLN